MTLGKKALGRLALTAAGVPVAAGLLAFLTWSALHLNRPTPVDVATLAFLICVAVAACVGALLPRPAIRRFLAYTVPIVGALYAYEFVARDDTGPLDDIVATVSRLRAEGRKATLQHLPTNYMANGAVQTLPDGSAVLPLSGPSDQHVVMCREGERPMAVFEADPFGMNNPKEAWAAKPQAAFVGDSFTYGACVARENHFLGPVRRHHPGTLNLAFGGYGPVEMLASLREYAGRVKPPVVFWMFQEAGVLPYVSPTTFEKELRHPVLARYVLEDGFTQNLADRQPQINRAVNDAADAWIDQRIHESGAWNAAKRFALLPKTRDLLRDALAPLNAVVGEAKAASSSADTVERYASVLRRAQQSVEGWGGRLVFVNIPHLPAFCFGGDSPMRRALLDLPRQLGLDTIDLEDRLVSFARENGPEALAAIKPCGGHFSEAAHGLIADILLQYLAARTADSAPAPGWTRITDPTDGTARLVYGGPTSDTTPLLGGPSWLSCRLRTAPVLGDLLTTYRPRPGLPERCFERTKG